MKILGLCCSQREGGNTEFLLNEVLQGARQEGAEIELYRVSGKEIKPCDGCHACRTTGECHIQDDMQEIRKKMKTADIIIFGSPSYYNNVTGIMKDFIDRSNPFYSTKKLHGKKAVLISVGGDDTGESIKDAINNMKVFCELNGMKVIKTYFAVALKANKISKNEKVTAELKELGESL